MHYPKFPEGHGRWWYVNAVFVEPPRKKSHGVRSGERGGQGRRCLSPFAASWKLALRPHSKHDKRTAGSTWETQTVATADSVRCACVRWEINFLLTFETAPFFCVYPVCVYISPVTLSSVLIHMISQHFWGARMCTSIMTVQIVYLLQY